MDCTPNYSFYIYMCYIMYVYNYCLLSQINKIKITNYLIQVVNVEMLLI